MIQRPFRLLIVLHGMLVFEPAHLTVHRYFCPKCKVVHRVDCELCLPTDEDAPLNELKFRTCKRCPGAPETGKRPGIAGGGSASKKQKAADLTLPVAADADAAIETSRYVRYAHAVERGFTSCARVLPVCPLDRSRIVYYVFMEVIPFVHERTNTILIDIHIVN